MYKKYLFFDIDGTLTNQNPGGVVLPSTLDTLEKLKENGYFVAIATGRNYAMARSAMDEAHIDNAVVCGGNGLILNNQVQYIRPLDKEKAMVVIKECLERNIPFGVNIDDSTILHTHFKNLPEVSPDLADFCQFSFMDNDDYSRFKEIHKIQIHLLKEESLYSLDKIGLHYARYTPYSVVVEPDDKFKGITDMVKRLGGSLEDVVVFGDGTNDLSMAKQAATSIAMGNAIQELKDIATFVTKDCDDDGIQYACQYFGWI